MLNTNALRTAIVGSISSTDYVNTVLHSPSPKKEQNYFLNISRFSALFHYFHLIRTKYIVCDSLSSLLLALDFIYTKNYN